MQTDLVLKVGATSNVKDVATAIAKSLDSTEDHVQMRAIGAGAVNQAVKAIAVARGQLATRGMDLWTRIGFATVNSTDGDISAVVFNLVAK